MRTAPEQLDTSAACGGAYSPVVATHRPPMPPMPLLDPYRKDSALTSRVLRAFYDVYNDLGFGFPESVYAHALCVEFQHAGVACRKEVVQEIVHGPNPEPHRFVYDNGRE